MHVASDLSSCSCLQGPRRLPSRVASRLQPIQLEVEVNEAAGSVRCTLQPTSPRFRALQALGSAIPQLAQQVCAAAHICTSCILPGDFCSSWRLSKEGMLLQHWQAPNQWMLGLPYNRQARNRMLSKLGLNGRQAPPLLCLMLVAAIHPNG